MSVPDRRTAELGRAGVFPEQAFAAPLAEARRFGFAVPNRSLGPSPAVMAAIRSETGRAPGARATSGEAGSSPPRATAAELRRKQPFRTPNAP